MAPGDIEVLSLSKAAQTICLTRLTVNRTVIEGQKLTGIQLTSALGDPGMANTPAGGPGTV